MTTAALIAEHEKTMSNVALKSALKTHLDSVTQVAPADFDAVVNSLDCGPRFEAIIGQGYWLDIFTYSNANTLLFALEVGELVEPTWLEDDLARKEDVYAKSVFTSFESAIAQVPALAMIIRAHVDGFDDV